MSTVFNVDEFNTCLQTAEIGRTIVYKDVTGSTMDDARRLAHSVSEYPHGTVIMSERQTKARGARDHTWDASNTGNIYVSLILHQPASSATFEGRFGLEVAACLAVLDTVQQLGVTTAKAKWPNDVWVRGHKLAGFLAEDGKFEIPGSNKCLMILGIGLNVNADTRRSAELCSIATSLRCERGGLPVPRESFFANVCLALEQKLSTTSQVNLEAFRAQNLFQPASSVSVTCSSDGKSTDAEFVDICSNWEVKFKEKNSEQVTQGRSDKFTVRPRVSRTLMVVFTGSLEKTVAQPLARWLTSLVDTTQYVVSLVPESSVTRSVDWCKNCSLLLLTSLPSQPDVLRDNVQIFLSSGGRVMAAGTASQFMAEVLGVPVRKALLASSHIHPELGLLHLHTTRTSATSTRLATTTTGEPHRLDNDQVCAPGAPSLHPNPLHSLLFPTNPVCFQFLEMGQCQLSSASSDPSNDSKENCDNKNGAPSAVVVQEADMPKECRDPGGDHVSETASASSTVSEVIAHCVDEGLSKVAVLMCDSGQGGRVLLCGFDLGVLYSTRGLEDLFTAKGVTADEVRAVSTDNFHRDNLLLYMLDKILG
ncbi:uncharacterized protein LOC101852626 [Aplysia californica]|uniref:Uncharacterized protein LOC101852626 n=1 Tax=Aplysia californica TaxID=6500 RepID=A0ABM0JPZ0_APLCA|nr:uncharacterized protein LOC101852626 [Aplysia californica]